MRKKAAPAVKDMGMVVGVYIMSTLLVLFYAETVFLF